MRIILKLKARNSIKQDDFLLKFHSAMHGFVYDKLKSNKKLKELHDKKEYAQFCFGNVYPIKNKEIKQREHYKIIISSPNPEVIQQLFFSIKKNQIINLGEGSFELEDASVIQKKLGKNDIIESVTPINLTVQEDGKIKAIKFSEQPERFKELLSKNLIKKYNYLKEEKTSLTPDEVLKNVHIESYKRKEASFKIAVGENHNKFFAVIGSKIVLKFNNIGNEQLKVFQYVFDLGFGERTSYGAGFMIKRQNK